MYIKYEDIHAFKRLDLSKIIESYGHTLKKHNGGFITNCPFHDDANPSLSINQKRDVWLWHCFGCNKGGTVIDFIMRRESLSLQETYRKLKELRVNNDSSSVIAGEAKQSKDGIASSLPSIASCNDHVPLASLGYMAGDGVLSDPKLLSNVLDHYSNTFKNNKKAQDYLSVERGLSNPEIYDRFKIGYSDGLLPKQNELIQGLKDLGILTESENDLFHDCVIFPVEDMDGNIVSLYGRHIEDKIHRYNKGPHIGVFNARAFKVSQTIFITEAIIDALSLYQVGIREVVSLFGTNGLTDDHIKYMKDTLTKEVILALDNDDSGKTATERIAGELSRELGIVCKTLTLPDGIKDINEWLLKGMTKDDVLKNVGEITSLPSEKPKVPRDDPVPLASLGCGASGGDIHIDFDDPKREYRVRGLNLKDVGSLRCSLKLTLDSGSHLDTFDLASSMSRERFKKMSKKLLNLDEAVIHQDLINVIDRIEHLQSEHLKNHNKTSHAKSHEMTDDERLEALSLLKDPRLLDRIIEDYHRSGYVGENTNLLMGYLAATSRRLDSPLSLITISRSSAGKSSLQDAVLSFIPEEDVIKYTRLTDQSLFYHEESSLYKKVLAIEEEAGARGAGYAIRNLLTSKYLKTSTTIKDPESGKLKSQSTSVRVQTSVFLTTTSQTLDHETLNRFIIATVDESDDQTKRILEYQRKLYGDQGHALRKAKHALIRLHSNAQRLLDDIDIVNPYQDSLTFTVKNLRARREQMKYLNLINVIAFLRQYQKPIKTRADNSRFIEVDSSDIDTANRLANIYIRRNLDYLSPQARALYGHIKEMITSIPSDTRNMSVSRRDIIESTKWSQWQVRTHLEELVSLEYIVASSGRQGKLYRYELVDELDYDIPEADIDIKHMKERQDSSKLSNFEDFEELCGIKTAKF